MNLDAYDALVRRQAIERYEMYLQQAINKDWPEMVEHWSNLIDKLENEE
jgi:hypothetical protein